MIRARPRIKVRLGIPALAIWLSSVSFLVGLAASEPWGCAVRFLEGPCFASGCIFLALAALMILEDVARGFTR